MYELAAEFAIHRTTVSQHLHAAGVHMRRQPFQATQIEVAVELYGEGFSVMEVGRRLGLSGSTVNNALLRNNVAMRKPWEHPLQRTIK